LKITGFYCFGNATKEAVNRVESRGGGKPLLARKQVAATTTDSY